MESAAEMGDDLKGTKDKIHVLLGFVQVLLEGKENKLMGEKQKVHALRF